jgi:aminoglycoside phosphotransferase (APT) family kinase protein
MSAQAGTAIDDFGGLIDWAGLNAWMAGRHVPGVGPVTAARKLAGGVQNSVFLLERGGESLVLRRPSKHLRANSNETMLREARTWREAPCRIPSCTRCAMTPRSSVRAFI